MKTPFCDFTFIPKVENNEVYVKAIHNTLPIVFARKYSWAVKNASSIEDRIINTTLKLKEDILNASEYGFISIVGEEKICYVWNKEKEAWFVMDEQNKNRIYE